MSVINNIALRSPQFKYKQVPVSNVASATCTITIDNVLRYTLVKNTKKSTTINFEIAELCRDYLDIEYTSTYVPNTIDIETVIRLYGGLDGTGTLVSTTTFNDVGWEAYGTFDEGTNPEVPSGLCVAKTDGEAVISAPQSSIGQSFTGYVPEISTTGVVSVNFYGANSLVIPSSNPSEIKRIDCTKYGTGTKIIFINKFGVQQDLWFYLKETKSMSRKNESYNSNTLTYPTTNSPATYSISNAPNKVFNTTAKQRFTLSSGYYWEEANEFFTQLLLSEYVWIERGSNVLPVKVVQSTVNYKTSVNDKLIEYTIEFEEAFDYINNIR